MSKRKLAVAMAGAMVATAVVPAFAAEKEVVKATISKNSAEATKLANDLRELLANGTKYERHTDGETTGEKVGKSVYGVYVAINSTILDADVKALADLGTTKTGLVEITNILELEKTINAIAENSEIRVYVVDKGHELVDGKISPVKAGYTEDVPSTILGNVTVEGIESGVVKKNMEVSELYDGQILTSAGLDLKYAVADSKLSTGYAIPGAKLTGGAIEISEAQKTITFEATIDYTDTSKYNETLKLTIKGTDLAHTKRLYDILGGTPEYTYTSKIAGSDRYATAEKIAAESGNTEFVLVNSTSMIDGLTAAPFAKATDASILLTSRDEISESTLEMIKDESASKEVTIIGGEAVISNKVVAQLNKVGIKVNRIGGKDRQETSVLVAEAMQKVLAKKATPVEIDRAFVVAATGEADAMGIASYAASENAPIVVEGFNGLSDGAIEVLKGNDVDVIGGNVTKETISTIGRIDDKINTPNVKVVAGVDRFETNAKILADYYADTIATQVFVAKDGYTEANNEALVDALAVGAYAAAENTATVNNAAPVILASSDVKTKQKEAIKLFTHKDDVATIVQVGNGVKHNVMNTLAKAFGLID